MSSVSVGIRSFLLSLVVASLMLGGHGFAQGAPIEQPRWLVTIPSAKNFARSTESAKFELSVPYPANDVLVQIGNELQLRGWHSADEDLITGTKTYVDGWRTVLDADGSFVYRWMADWVDGSGNGVTYILTYHYRPAAGGRFTPNDHLEVIAKFWAAAEYRTKGSNQKP
jgi:hypothetical protein